jgi:hypothetical protein
MSGDFAPQTAQRMKVSEISPCAAHWIEFEGDKRSWLRFGPHSWMFTAGENMETEYDCEEHEAAYQAAVRSPKRKE